MFKFEWDQAKAKANHKKHRVSFEEAVSVFGDHNALTFQIQTTLKQKTEVALSVCQIYKGYWS